MAEWIEKRKRNEGLRARTCCGGPSFLDSFQAKKIIWGASILYRDLTSCFDLAIKRTLRSGCLLCIVVDETSFTCISLYIHLEPIYSTHIHHVFKPHRSVTRPISAHGDSSDSDNRRHISSSIPPRPGSCASPPAFAPAPWSSSKALFLVDGATAPYRATACPCDGCSEGREATWGCEDGCGCDCASGGRAQ